MFSASEWDPDDDLSAGETPPEPAPCWWCGAVLVLCYDDRFCCDSCSLNWCRWSRSEEDQSQP